MITECPSCSQPGSERSNPQAEARCGEPVSRNPAQRDELDSASLHYPMGVTHLPDWLKSVTDGEATLTSIRRAPRGDWRQRAGKEKSRNLRGPSSVATQWRESDDSIVAGKGLTRLERRGSTVSVQPSKLNSSVWLKADCGIHELAAMDAEHASSMGMFAGKPDAGNPHVRFDEGEWQERHNVEVAACRSLLYWAK